MADKQGWKQHLRVQHRGTPAQGCWPIVDGGSEAIQFLRAHFLYT